MYWKPSPGIRSETHADDPQGNSRRGKERLPQEKQTQPQELTGCEVSETNSPAGRRSTPI